MMAQPSSFLYHYRHALNLFQSGHYEEALTALKNALLMEPNFPDAYVAIAKIHDELGNYEDSISLYKKLESMLPNDQEISKRLAAAYEKSGDKKRAVRKMRQVIRSNPRDTQARCQLARWLIADRRFRAANSLLRKGIRVVGTCAEFYNLMGEIRRYQKKLEMAQEYYEQCLEIDPDHSGAKRGISQVIRAMDAGDAAVASDQDSQDTEAREELVEAAQLFTDGKYDVAIVKLQALREKRAVKRQASILLGLAYVRKSLFKRARDIFYDLANTMRPETLVLFNLGLTSNRIGEYEVAIRALTEALEADPEYYEALLELGFAYQRTDNIKKARETYLRAIRLTASDPRAYALIARLEYDLKHKKQAEQILMRGLRIDSQSPELLLTQGYILLKEKQPQRAVGPLQQCVKLAPNSFEAHRNLGHVLELLGNTVAATKSYRMAYQLNPSDEDCRLQIERLESV
ncbi:MAG TPA: tetratricopeptide repeat protein [bacterium]|nr:tetratricopeptide repeat protein [bacterium]HQL62997.1 tetratricopeptide repeat protein [bacterium]